MKLPTKPSEPCNKFDEYSYLITGPKGVGKTTLMVDAGADALWINTDNGLKAHSVMQVVPETWAEFEDYIDLFRAGDHKYRHLVIDSVDRAFELCEKHICKKYKKESIGEIYRKQYIMGPGYALNEFTRVFRKVTDISPRWGLWAICHIYERNIDDDDSTSVRFVLNLPEKVRQLVLGDLDIVLSCEFAMVPERDKNGEKTGTKQVRVIKTSSGKTVESRDRSARLPKTINMSLSALEKAFNAAGAADKPSGDKPDGKKDEKKEVGK